MDESARRDALLAVRCQLGEAAAWDELVLRWHPRLWRFVSRMVPGRAAAEDVLQVVWLRAMRSLVRLREPTRLAAWLYGLARAAVADRLRGQYRRPPPAEFDGRPDADATSDAVDVADEVEAVLDRLHPADREVLVLHYLEERPVGEVARICDVPAGTVKSRLHRARRAARAALHDKETPDESD